MERFPLLWGSAEVGEVAVERDGLYICFRLRRKYRRDFGASGSSGNRGNSDWEFWSREGNGA